LLLDFPAILVPEAVREEVELGRPEAIRQSRVPLHFQPAGDFPTAPLRTLVRTLAALRRVGVAKSAEYGGRWSHLLDESQKCLVPTHRERAYCSVA
jgi:hypothetical protein